MKKSIFNLIENPNDLPSTNENMSDLYYREILPTREIADKIVNNRLQQKFSNGNISFQWNFDNRTWFIPSRSYFKFTIEIARPDGTPLLVADKVAPNMGLCPSLLQRIHFKMNNQTISNVSQFVAQTDALAHRINNSSEWLNNTTGNSIDFWDYNQKKRVHEISADGHISNQFSLSSPYDAPVDTRYFVDDRSTLGLSSTYGVTISNAGLVTFTAIAPNAVVYAAATYWNLSDLCIITPPIVGGADPDVTYAGIVVEVNANTITLGLYSTTHKVAGVNNINNWSISRYRLKGLLPSIGEGFFTTGNAAAVTYEYVEDTSMLDISGPDDWNREIFETFHMFIYKVQGGNAYTYHIDGLGLRSVPAAGVGISLFAGIESQNDVAANANDEGVLVPLGFNFDKISLKEVLPGVYSSLCIQDSLWSIVYAPAAGFENSDLRSYVAIGDYIGMDNFKAAGAFVAACLPVIKVEKNVIYLGSTNYTARALQIQNVVIRWRAKNYEAELEAAIGRNNNISRAKTTFDLCWKPAAMSIFNYPGAIPGGCKFEFELQGVSNDYIYRAVETPKGLTFVPLTNGTEINIFTQNYRLLVKDLKFYCCQVEGPVVGNEEYSYYLNLNEIRAHSKDITSASLVQTNVDVMESSYAIAIAFQDVRSANDTGYSITKFKLGDEEELALQRYNIRFAGISLPQPDAEIKYSTSEELLLNQYLRNQLYTNLYYKQSGGESLQEWKERGIYFYHPFIRSAGNKEQRAYILTKFNLDEANGKVLSETGLQNMQLYIFEFYRAFALIKMKNGYIYDIKTANQ